MKPPHATILIVEDERIVAMDMQRTLHRLGYDAYAIASTAEEAIARASERCPDLALMDIRIKGRRDGIEVAQLLKNQFHVPVVFLTAYADDATVDRAKRTDPEGYLVKPVKTAALRSAVEVALHKHDVEMQLRQTASWSLGTLRSIRDSVIATGQAGEVSFLNPAAEELLGWSLDAAKGKPVRDVVRLANHDGPEESPLLKALQRADTAPIVEACLVNASTGARRFVRASAAPVTVSGQTSGAVMMIREVGDPKRDRQVDLAERLASLGTLASGVAHEVNNALMVVKGTTEFLQADLEVARHQVQGAGPAFGELDKRLEAMRGDLEALANGADRIDRIVEKLRQFSTAPTSTPRRATDVSRCVAWAIRMAGPEFHDRARLVQDIRPVPRVCADETRLGHVFLNLLINAAQACVSGQSDKNTVTIATRKDDVGRVVVEVSDTGKGISEADAARVFEPFFTTKRSSMRSGLGLSISHGIVKSLRGEIDLESKLGQGTTVRVTLPSASDECDAEDASEQAQSPGDSKP